MKDILIKFISKLFEYSVFVSMAGIVIILSANVFLRYVVHRPFAWAEEITVLFNVWVVLLGAGLVQKREEHVAITYVFDLFPARGKNITMIFINVCICLVLIVHLFSGWNLLKLQMKSSMLALDWPMGLFALGVFVGMAGMLLFTADSIMKGLKDRGISKQ
jgi:TRAP-type C4-dicarboxylate transport system permease small subunit